ncbi:MAG: TatD family hydrolase, partial [Ruthenibacterium sp.]
TEACMIFDTHAHYTTHLFDDHRDALLQSLPAQGVVCVVDCATDFSSAQQSLALGLRYPWLYTAAGIHPESLIDAEASTKTMFGGDWRAELAALEPLYQNPRVVAVGECGLDYHWPIPKDEQRLLFRAELETAKAHDLPILIHDREAHADTYALLREYHPKGIVHCYSGSADDALWLTAQGLYLGVGGVVTFPNSRRLQETVAAVPLAKLVLETDCPYMAPVPFRGKECNSAMLAAVAEKVAQIKGMTAAEVLEITEQNARALFCG